MIPRHSFCFFTVATMASFMFKFYLFWDFMFRANFSEIYAVKARVWASKRLNQIKIDQTRPKIKEFKPNQSA